MSRYLYSVFRRAREPSIIPGIFPIKIEGKEVIGIEVEEEIDKLNNYRNRRVSVRRNRTTGIAYRFELDDLCKKSQIPLIYNS
jgi:hypothetical protein